MTGKGLDAAIYTTLRFGYDSDKDSFDDIPEVAESENISAKELVVIQFIEREKTHAEN